MKLSWAASSAASKLPVKRRQRLKDAVLVAVAGNGGVDIAVFVRIVVRRWRTLAAAEDLPQGGGLVFGFGVFVGGIGVGDDGAADVEVEAVARGVDGADGDTAAEVTVEADGRDGPAVTTARDRFQRGDDLHGADLGCAGDRATRETGGEHFGGSRSGAGRGDDARLEVVDGRERTQDDEFGYPDRAGGGDAAEVITEDVDNHDVFGTVFGAGAQRGGELAVLEGIGAARAGAFDGAGFDVVEIAVQEGLR